MISKLSILNQRTTVNFKATPEQPQESQRVTSAKAAAPAPIVTLPLPASVTKTSLPKSNVAPRLGVTEVAVPPPGLNLNPALNLLSSQDRDALQRIAAGSAGERAKIDYLALLKSPGFNTLPPSVQAKALQTLLALEPAQADAAAEIGGLLNAPADRLLSDEDKCKLLDVFRSATATGREQLLELVERTGIENTWIHGTLVHQETTPLLDRNSSGKTLLDCMYSAANDSSGALTKAVRAAQGTLSSLLLEASRPCMQNLGTAERGKLLDIQAGNLGSEYQDAYQRIVRSDNCQRLSADNQAHVLFALVRLNGEPGSAVSLADLVDSPPFAEHSKDLLDVFNATNAEGRQELVSLADRSLSEGLLNRDTNGGTLLGSLQQLATAPLDPLLAQHGVTRESLLGSILQEIAEPGEINQGNRGTCTVTSMQYMLCLKNPAEYARLMMGLLSPAGEVKLANGDMLHRVTDSVPPDDDSVRSASERIFQCAMMDYADNAGLHDDYENSDPKDAARGLSVYEQRHGLEGLFGREFHLWGLGGYVHRDMVDVLKDAMPTPTLVDLHWPDDTGDDKGHAVVVLRIEGDRVYIRNPWGADKTLAPGTMFDNPPRILEDPANRIESMSLADFKDALKNVYQAD